MTEKQHHQDNQADLQAITADIQNTLARAREASANSLQDFRSVGASLVRAKHLVPRGGYLDWAYKTFGFSKQWCSNLTRLATSWSDYERARSWATAEGHLLGRREYSVDGALALIRKWRRAVTPAPDTDESKHKQRKRSLREELEEVQRKLAEAESEIKRLKAKPNAGSRSKRSARRARPARIDKETKRRASAIAGYWKRSNFPAEQAVAEGKLRNLAEKHGYEFEQFLKDCGIESPVNWTFAQAA